MSTRTLWSPDPGGRLPQALVRVSVCASGSGRGRVDVRARACGVRARVLNVGPRARARALWQSRAHRPRDTPWLSTHHHQLLLLLLLGSRRAGHDRLQRGRTQLPRRRLLLRSPWTPQPRNLADFVAALDGQLHGVVQILSGATWGQPAAGAARIRAYAKCVRARARAWPYTRATARGRVQHLSSSGVAPRVVRAPKCEPLCGENAASAGIPPIARFRCILLLALCGSMACAGGACPTVGGLIELE